MKKIILREKCLFSMRNKYFLRSLFLLILNFCSSIYANEVSSINEAITSGKAYGDVRLRYEAVEQDNALADAKSLTMRTQLGYKTGVYQGFSAVVEFEDSRIVAGIDEFSVPLTGFNLGEYAIIPDPEVTEVDQAFIQYKNDMVTMKIGSQVIALDGQRFIGHVGWRQDRVTYDAISTQFKPIDDLTITLAHIYGRNRLFAEVGDQDAKDNIFNAAYKANFGIVTAYAYLLEDDFGLNTTRDTYGASINGSTNMNDTKIIYTAEYARQSLKDNTGMDYSMDYLFLEAGAVINMVTAKFGYEILGSDDGQQGFFTPLATVHKFNGWADLFILSTPTGGLKDMYLSVNTKLKFGNITASYHNFSADDDSSGVDDYGSELDLAYSLKFGKIYNAGIKYANYSSEGLGVDTNKLWIWFGFKI